MTDFRTRLSEISKIDDSLEALEALQALAREEAGEDVIVLIEELPADLDVSAGYGSGEFLVDFGKLTELHSSYRYIQFILRDIVSSLHGKKDKLETEASHKYSFVDTLSAEEIEAVRPHDEEGRKKIFIYVTLHS